MSFFAIKGGYITISEAAWWRSAAGAALALAIATSGGAMAQNATWNGASTAFGDSANWTPTTVPTGTATFTNTGSAHVDDSLGGISIGTFSLVRCPTRRPTPSTSTIR